MKVTLEFEIGKRTCASQSGKIKCPFLRMRNFGQKPVCLWFGEDLHESNPGDLSKSWLLRCPSCLEEFGESDDVGQGEICSQTLETPTVTGF